MNIWDLIVSMGLIVLLLLAVTGYIHGKRHGKGCTGNCAGCMGCGRKRGTGNHG